MSTISILEEMRHRSFSSGQKAPDKSHWHQWLLWFMLLFCCIGGQNANAVEYDCEKFRDNTNRFVATAYPEGYIHIKILCYWEDCVAGTGDSRLGDININYGGSKIFSITYNKSNYKISDIKNGVMYVGGTCKEGTLASNGSSFSLPANGKRYIEIYFYPNSFTSPIMVAGGTWYYSWLGENPNPITPFTRTLEWQVPELGKIAIDSFKLDFENKRTVLYGFRARLNPIDAGEAYDYSLLADGNTKNNYVYDHWTYNGFIYRFNVYAIKTEAANYNSKYTFKAACDKGGHVFETTSNTFKVPAFIYPVYVDAVYNSEEKVVNIKWNTPTVSGVSGTDYINSGYIIKRRSVGSNNWTVVGSTKTAKDITFTDSSFVNENDILDSYIYRVETVYANKNNYFGDNYTAQSQAVKVSTNHMNVYNLVVKVDTASEAVSLNWNVSGKSWASGSELIVSRKNASTKKTEVLATYTDSSKVVKSNDGGVLSGSYEDNAVALCTQYIYRVYVDAGDAYGDLGYLESDTILLTDIGSMNKLTCSKGYYPDRTEVNWSSEGFFDMFVVERKLAAENDSKYKQIATVASNRSQQNYIYQDNTCVPGEIYTYRVYGKVDCGNKTISSGKLIDCGFRTPTGDFYGRVTYENGQSVDSVEVSLSTDESIPTQSLSINKEGVSTNIPQLVGSSALTFQAWMTFSNSSAGTIKLGDYSIAFSAGGKVVLSDNKGSASFQLKGLITEDVYHHITAVFKSKRLELYVDGVLLKSQKTSNTISNKSDSCVIGKNYVGYLDEVRIWTRALTDNEISRDYNRYIVGNEKSLVCYYTFNFIGERTCYDMSQDGLNYNGNDGKLGDGTSTSPKTPSDNQLAYKGMTDESGAYSIRSVPYYGNGTAYTLTPTKGSHQFSPTQEIRLISGSVPSHTVNFTDNSSFYVSGIVMYSGGNYPVEGVSFKIDGVTAMSKTGEYIVTDADGKFTISVPVGIHEVKAFKDGHTFDLDGRICENNGSNHNYQDVMVNVQLYDNTKVKYIGRICGGEVQESYPVGFSLSKNNMAEDMQVVLSLPKEKYDLQTKENVHQGINEHLIRSSILANDKNAKRTTSAKTTVVDYNQKDITIHVNNETGEFEAWVYPIDYIVSLSVYGKGKISGDGSSLNMSTYGVTKYETYEYTDTLYANGKDTLAGYTIASYKDSVSYYKKQVFNQRNSAQMELVQLNKSGRDVNYFGSKKYTSSNLSGDNFDVALYVDSTKAYTFGLPVFLMNESYSMRYSIFEEYPYYTDELNTNSDKTDRVNIDGATVQFYNKFAYSSVLDTVNQIYTFKANEPDMTTAKGTIAATFTYGDSDNPKSVSLTNPLGNANGEAFVLGSHQTGVNFVTGGPNKMLCVLRDPPGSNSYSYLEKGTSFTQSSTYTGSFNHEGSETWATGTGTKLLSFTGANTPASSQGTVKSVVESNTGVTAGIVQEAEYTGSNSKSTNVTLTTRIQTSDDPIYDGANGDLYVGYSTNISFGSTNTVSIVPIQRYDSVGGDEYFDVTYAKNKDFAMVKTKGISTLQNFNTMFAYPQIFIEQTLLPNLEDLRKSLIIPKEEAGTDSVMQFKADRELQNYYVSTVSANDPSFGEEDSYKVFYTKGSIKCDTIHYLNQAIAAWKKALSDNDSVKASTSSLLQNFSFQAGANVEYSESYTSNLSSSHSFSVKVGASVSDDADVTIGNVNSKFSFEETFSTTQGGEFANEAEASHSKGFVLADEGDDDYLSVDVLYEDPSFDNSYVSSVGAGSADTSKLQTKDFYPTFVFRTRGGATSCPYEDEYRAVHWNGHEDQVISVATMKLEEPAIDMPVKFVENVPSGEDAYLTVYMKNNSETGEDQWFDLRMVDASNPYGAVPSIDGNSMSGFALEYLVPAGDVLEKTIAITKGSVLNYDNLALVLASKCQADPTGFLDVIADTVYFSVHFVPSCTDVTISKPTNNWTYNTNCAADTIDGLEKHYMPIVISGFDVNYTDFEHIELQYKTSSSDETKWVTLGYYYKEDSLTQKALKNGLNAFTIASEDGGSINYKFYMDNLPDQKYDLRAVSYCNINNQIFENPSVVISGIKDMYNPRLFGAPKPANGVLTIEDDVRIDFNETIADGLLTVNNFEVTGIRNGVASSHDVAISLDGKNDYLATEATRNFASKDLTFECWVYLDELQNATFFSHGSKTKSIEMGMNSKGNAVVKVAGKEFVSDKPAAWEKSTWNHVALVYDNANKLVTAYVNYSPVITDVSAPAYSGNGVVVVGRSVSTSDNYFKGKVDQFRIWNDVRSRSTIQANSSIKLSGNDLNLVAYYEMDEAKGSATEDKARGANLLMKGCEWALPEGRSASFGGKGYVAMDASSAVITSDMDFTLEFWFNAAENAQNQTILSTGNGVSSVGENPANVFSIGFDANSKLSFYHNGKVKAVNGKYADNNWHNFTMCVNRSTGIARIYMDGVLNTYFDAENIVRLSSDKLYAGARVWRKAANATPKADQYFTGQVDEIRLWKLYRQQSQIESFYNQKVEGSEMGLLLYYPFEHYKMWQGNPEMQFTLEDKANAQTIKTETVGNVEETTNIPPVKSLGSVSPLLYDWVVNNDALIITLREQDYRVEKTIVNFTVNKVQDVNGNYIVSPITWSAYIDRNQLKWMDDAVTVEKKQNEAYSFEAQIVNNGGSVINYSLDNMPSWLSASVESGAINPLEKQTIEFEIDPALAVGSYDEVIYLTNSNNVTEPLKLNVTVEGDTPDWNVDPNKYQFNMIVYAQLKIDNEFSNDKNDMLAAFYNGECVGVANVSYDKTLDMWYAMMTVYSEKSSKHDLEYRMWDASEGRMLSAKASMSEFEDNKVLGSPASPAVFTNGSVKYQNIQLNKGWNWISFNLKNSKMSDLNTYLAAGSWNKNSHIKNMSGSANYSAVNKKWSKTDDNFKVNNQSMFKVYSDIDQTLTVSGSDIDLSSTTISVKKKSWNYIAYLPTFSTTLKAALADYEAEECDVIKSNDGFAMYYGNEWVGSLKSMQPNCGYMLKNTSSKDKSFAYPTGDAGLRSGTPVETKASSFESNMSIIAYAPEKEEGDVVRAMVGNDENEVYEVALTDDYALQFISVSAKNGDNVRFTLERNGVTYEATKQMAFAGDNVYGTPSSPILLDFNLNGTESLKVYPNPVVDVLNISGMLDADGDATIELLDVVGRVVYSRSVNASDKALEAAVNMTGLASGSYVLKITQNDEVKTFKIVKK